MSNLERNILSFMCGLTFTLWAFKSLKNYTSLGISQRAKSIQEAEDKDCQMFSAERILGLYRMGNLVTKENILRITLNRAASEKHLAGILEACEQREDIESLRIGVTAVLQICHIDGHRSILVRMKALRILVRVLSFDCNQKIHCFAVQALYKLVHNQDKRKIRIVNYGILNPLLQFLRFKPQFNSDLKYWSLHLLHQLILTEDLHSSLIDSKVVYLLADMSRLTFGNSSMQKLCFHSMVRLFSNISDDDAIDCLQILYDHRLIAIIGACLRNDDAELVSWAIFLLHEFVSKDIGTTEIASLRKLLDICAVCLFNKDTVLARIVLRILKSLSTESLALQKKMMKAKLASPLVNALKSHDAETQYWSLAIIHELVFVDDFHSQLISAGLIPTLVELCDVASNQFIFMISDIFISLFGNGMFCVLFQATESLNSDESKIVENETALADSNALETLLFLQKLQPSIMLRWDEIIDKQGASASPE